MTGTGDEGVYRIVPRIDRQAVIDYFDQVLDLSEWLPHTVLDLDTGDEVPIYLGLSFAPIAPVTGEEQEAMFGQQPFGGGGRMITSRPAYWHELTGVTFEPAPCGTFIGVRLEGEVVGMLSPAVSVPFDGPLWRAHGKGGAHHAARTINECVGWMIAHRERLAREGK